MALSIDIAANTRAAQAQVGDLGDALDKVADALDDVARDAQRSGDKAERAFDGMEKGLTGVAREADDAADKVEKSFREMVKDAERADDKIGKTGDKGGGFSKAGEASGEFKDEALSNFSEVTSSFDGSMSSIQDLAQGTLGGLASSGLPGIGLAAGAAAVGVGLIGSAIEANDEAMKASEERTSEWAQAYIEGTERMVGASHVLAQIQDITTDTEKYKKATESAKDWGVDVGTAISAMAGDQTALAIATESSNKRVAEWGEILRKTSTGSANSWDKSNMTGKQREFGQSVLRGRDALGLQNKEMTEGQRRANNAASALAGYAERVGVATGKTDKLGNAIYKLPDETEIVIDAKTGRAYEDLTAVEKKARNLPDGKVRVRVDDLAIRQWKPPVKQGTVVYNSTMRKSVL